MTILFSLECTLNKTDTFVLLFLSFRFSYSAGCASVGSHGTRGFLKAQTIEPDFFHLKFLFSNENIGDRGYGIQGSADHELDNYIQVFRKQYCQQRKDWSVRRMKIGRRMEHVSKRCHGNRG